MPKQRQIQGETSQDKLKHPKLYVTYFKSIHNIPLIERGRLFVEATHYIIFKYYQPNLLPIDKEYGCF